ncbi:MauE/DoxX family redox-associated membrane protein [Nakamurella sp. GG22]
MVGLLAAMSLLLAVAGVGKVAAPRPAAKAWAAARIPGAGSVATPVMIRLLGLAELLIAVAVLVLGGSIPAVLLSVAYLLLTAVAWRMIRVAPQQDCGCFGRASEPISRSHLAVNGAGVVIGAAAAIWPQPSFVIEVTSLGGAESVLLVVLTALLTWLCYLLMTVLPALLQLRAKVATPR